MTVDRPAVAVLTEHHRCRQEEEEGDYADRQLEDLGVAISTSQKQGAACKTYEYPFEDEDETHEEGRVVAHSRTRRTIRAAGRVPTSTTLP